MSRASWSTEVSSMLPADTMLPSRSTVKRVQTSMTSRSLCEMKTMPTPLFCSVRIISKTRWISGSVREVVGSSMMMIEASIRSARAISTICL